MDIYFLFIIHIYIIAYTLLHKQNQDQAIYFLIKENTAVTAVAICFSQVKLIESIQLMWLFKAQIQPTSHDDGGRLFGVNQ